MALVALHIHVSATDETTQTRLSALEAVQARLEKRMDDFNTTLAQENTDVKALLQKDTMDVADRDAARSALAKAQDSLASGTFVSPEEKAEIVATAAALHAFLNPAITPPAPPAVEASTSPAVETSTPSAPLATDTTGNAPAVASTPPATSDTPVATAGDTPATTPADTSAQTTAGSSAGS